MKRNIAENSRYFQTVSRVFLDRRGAPFFLSAKEVENIKEWKKMGIPLQIVLDGIKDCFAARRRRSGRKGKILSLAFCHPFVLHGYQAYRERKVGDQKKYLHKEDHRKILKKAVEQFLVSCPESFPDIRKVFSRALKLISQGTDEELLEALENEVEALIMESVSETERKQIRREAMIEFGEKNLQERERIQKLKLIKYFREKYKIPHISLYYY